MLLKARQFGFSTLILGMFFCDTVNNPNTQTVIIAQDKDSTQKLFQIVKRYQDNLPIHKRIPLKYDTKTELYWPSIDSYFVVATQGAKKVGRGGTINNVHASEVAFWDNADEILAGLMQAVPEDGNIFCETTANGINNWFYDEYTNAQDGRSAFKAFFFPWFQHSEYHAKKLSNGQNFVATEEEEAFKERYDLSREQLIWYRNKTIELKDKVVQEYPSNAEEAFVSTGSSYFNKEALKVHLERVDAPLEVSVPIRWREVNVPEIKIWKLPVVGHRYVIGADPAEGIRDNGEHDYCSADVIDYDTWEQVAQLHGQWDTHQFGLMLGALGGWYNNAMINVERNNHGHAVLNSLMHSVGYPHNDRKTISGLYMHEEYDSTKKTMNRRPGYPSNVKTKVLMLDTLATDIEEHTIHIRARESVRELMAFSKLPGGKFGAEGKAHDDRVTSLGLAVVCLRVRLRAVVKQPPKRIREGGYV